LRVLLQLVMLIRLMIAPREAITVSGRDYVAGGRERMRSGNGTFHWRGSLPYCCTEKRLALVLWRRARWPSHKLAGGDKSHILASGTASGVAGGAAILVRHITKLIALNQPGREASVVKFEAAGLRYVVGHVIKMQL
jgi:hypothetical protein